MHTHLENKEVDRQQLVLVREITHRVVNETTQAIASISRAASHATDAQARSTLIAAAETLHAFADAHRALQTPTITGDGDLGDYLERLCGALSLAGLRDRDVRLLLSRDTVAVDAERCWRVGLIVSELITNAVRHGFKGAQGVIAIDLRTVGREVLCTVADNGRSCPDPTPSRGSHVISGLAADLGGTASWRFGSAGVTVRLSFPQDRDCEDRTQWDAVERRTL